MTCSLQTVFAVLSLLGCDAKVSSAGADDSAGADADATCDSLTIDETLPLNGAADAYYRSAVEFQLSAPDPSATVSAAFPGATSTRDDGATIVYTPESPLAPDTEYVVGLDYCRGEAEISFRTSSYGEAVSEPLVGRTYVVDLVGGRFLQGGNLAGVIAAVFNRSLLLHILAEDGDTLTVRAGISTAAGESMAQDTCFRTTDVEAVDFTTTPFFAIGVDRFGFEAFETQLDLINLTVEGTFATDGEAVGGVRYGLAVSAADVAGVLGLEGGVEEACGFAETLDESCGPCPDDSSAECLVIITDGIDAPEVGFPVVPVDDPESDPDCQLDTGG